MMFQQFLHRNRPSNDELFQSYGVKPLPILQRSSFSGWTDPQEPPSFAWNQSAVRIQSESNILVFDFEDWPQGTRSERLQTARKFQHSLAIYRTVRPEMQIGYYATFPKRDLFRAILPTNHPDFLTWQSENDDGQDIIRLVDVLFPSIYWYYTRAVNGPNYMRDAPLYFRRNIEEAQRIASQYGRPGRPVIPYVWWMRHDGTAPLDLDAWACMLKTALDMTGSAVIWGGSGQEWNDQEPWLQVVKQCSKVY